MATIDETGEHGSTKTFVNRTPAEDVRAGILDGDHVMIAVQPGPHVRPDPGRGSCR